MNTFFRTVIAFCCAVVGVNVAPMLAQDMQGTGEALDPFMCRVNIFDDDVVGNYILDPGVGIMSMGADTMLFPDESPSKVTIFVLNDKLGLESDDGHLNIEFTWPEKGEDFPLLDSIPNGTLDDMDINYGSSFEDFAAALGCEPGEFPPVLTGVATGSLLSADGVQMKTIVNMFVHGLSGDGVFANGIIEASGGGLVLFLPFTLKPAG